MTERVPVVEPLLGGWLYYCRFIRNETEEKEMIELCSRFSFCYLSWFFCQVPEEDVRAVYNHGTKTKGGVHSLRRGEDTGCVEGGVQRGGGGEDFEAQEEKGNAGADQILHREVGWARRESEKQRTMLHMTPFFRSAWTVLLFLDWLLLAQKGPTCSI